MQTTHKLCTSLNSVKKVVIWKDGRTIALGNTCDAFLTTETISYRCTVVVLKNQCLIYYVFFDNVFFSYQRVILVSRYILYTLTMCCFVFRSYTWLLRRPLNSKTFLRMRKRLGGH